MGTPSAFELDFLARERDLAEFRGLLVATATDSSGSGAVLVPLIPGVALMRGTLPSQRPPLVHLGAGFYLQTRSYEEATFVLERILRRKLVEWAQYLEEEDNNTSSDAERTRFQAKFVAAPAPPPHTTTSAAAEEVVYFEPYE